MPELPEVETMRRGIQKVVGSTVQDVHFPRCRFRPIRITPAKPTFRRRVTGRVIQRIDRVGKRVVALLDSQHSIVFEPRMTGLVLLADPPDLDHLRFSLTFQGKPNCKLLFWDRRGLGSVRLLSSRQFDHEIASGKLGPDALSLSAQDLRARLCSSRRAIKVALLDQRALAGIGNLYASEILHVAGVHPEKRCHRISRTTWTAIHQAIQFVLNEAIRFEGSTLSDGTYRNALNQTGRYQNCHRVYNRKGELCAQCNRGHVRRIVQSQRSTFFCPVCQTKGRRG